MCCLGGLREKWGQTELDQPLRGGNFVYYIQTSRFMVSACFPPLYPNLSFLSSRPPPPPGSKLYLLWCRMLSSERQYAAVLKGVEETYLPLLELSDTPASVRGKADALFPNWSSLSSFHSQNLLPAMEGALVQSLLQQDCFSKYVSPSQVHTAPGDFLNVSTQNLSAV